MRPEFLWQRSPSSPHGLPLFLLQEGDCRSLAAILACGQDIAADGAFSLGMIAEYMDSLVVYGAGFYRNLFWEAGLVGQVLYLDAEAAGIRATGIGCLLRRSSSRGLRNLFARLAELLPFHSGWPS